MGRLAGFRYRDITRRFKALGLEFHPNQPGDMPECTLRALFEQAVIEPGEGLRSDP